MRHEAPFGMPSSTERTQTKWQESKAICAALSALCIHRYALAIGQIARCLCFAPQSAFLIFPPATLWSAALVVRVLRLATRCRLSRRGVPFCLPACLAVAIHAHEFSTCLAYFCRFFFCRFCWPNQQQKELQICTIPREELCCQCDDGRVCLHIIFRK